MKLNATKLSVCFLLGLSPTVSLTASAADPARPVSQPTAPMSSLSRAFLHSVVFQDPAAADQTGEAAAEQGDQAAGDQAADADATAPAGADPTNGQADTPKLDLFEEPFGAAEPQAASTGQANPQPASAATDLLPDVPGAGTPNVRPAAPGVRPQATPAVRPPAPAARPGAPAGGTGLDIPNLTSPPATGRPGRTNPAGNPAANRRSDATQNRTPAANRPRPTDSSAPSYVGSEGTYAFQDPVVQATPSSMDGSFVTTASCEGICSPLVHAPPGGITYTVCGSDCQGCGGAGCSGMFAGESNSGNSGLGGAGCDDLFGGDSCWGGDCLELGGWVSFGYHSKGNDLFNSRPDNFALHQAWLYLEKAATESSPIGFRADLMYGLDAGDTQSFGNPPGSWDNDDSFQHGSYGWAIPQLYATFLAGDWSIQAGHFYTLVGYEVVTAPDNFFYSHAMTMYNSEPFTHTGVLATREVSDEITIYAGWTLGWDSGFDQFGDGNSWLGGVGLTLLEGMELTYISTAGDFGARGDDAYSHSVVLDMTLTERLNWVVQSDLVRVASKGEDNVGINQYFLYSVNDSLSLGTRLEWWKGDVVTDYAPHGATLPAAGSLSYYAATFGANIRSHAESNLVIRPEVRVDWSPAADYDETYFGVDAVLSF